MHIYRPTIAYVPRLVLDTTIKPIKYTPGIVKPEDEYKSRSSPYGLCPSILGGICLCTLLASVISIPIAIFFSAAVSSTTNNSSNPTGGSSAIINSSTTSSGTATVSTSTINNNGSNSSTPSTTSNNNSSTTTSLTNSTSTSSTSTTKTTSTSTSSTSTTKTTSTSTSSTSTTKTTSTSTSRTSSTTTSTTTSTSTSSTTTTTPSTSNCTTAGRGSLLYLSGLNPSNWTFYNFNYTANASFLTLMFGFQNDNNRYYYLDSVSVVDTSAPGTELLQNPSFENSTTTATGWMQLCTDECTNYIGAVVTGTKCYLKTGNCFEGSCSGSSGIDYLGQSFMGVIGHKYKISFRLFLGGTGSTGKTKFYADVV